MSGAGRIKFDGSDDDWLYEVKDANKSFALSSQLLYDLYMAAIRQRKSPMLLIYFREHNITAQLTVVPGGKEMIQ
jgi:hypothetical protein